MCSFNIRKSRISLIVSYLSPPEVSLIWSKLPLLSNQDLLLVGVSPKALKSCLLQLICRFSSNKCFNNDNRNSRMPSTLQEDDSLSNSSNRLVPHR